MHLSRNFSPNRIIINKQGDAVPLKIAIEKYHIFPDIIFMRRDGWSLGAPKELENVAYNLWKDEWQYYIIRPSTEWQPITNYKYDFV